MESIVRQNLLYDFYGELLTRHQRSVYEDIIFHDMSLAEVAQAQGITRQGVHDLVRRCDHILNGYEEKLHLISKFQKTKEMAREVKALAHRFAQTGDPELIRQIERISDSITEL